MGVQDRLDAVVNNLRDILNDLEEQEFTVDNYLPSLQDFNKFFRPEKLAAAHQALYSVRQVHSPASENRAGMSATNSDSSPTKRPPFRLRKSAATPKAPGSQRRKTASVTPKIPATRRSPRGKSAPETQVSDEASPRKSSRVLELERKKAEQEEMQRKVEAARANLTKAKQEKLDYFTKLAKKDPTLKILGYDAWHKNLAREKTIQDLDPNKVGNPDSGVMGIIGPQSLSQLRDSNISPTPMEPPGPDSPGTEAEKRRQAEKRAQEAQRIQKRLSKVSRPPLEKLDPSIFGSPSSDEWSLYDYQEGVTPEADVSQPDTSATLTRKDETSATSRRTDESRTSKKSHERTGTSGGTASSDPSDPAAYQTAISPGLLDTSPILPPGISATGQRRKSATPYHTPYQTFQGLVHPASTLPPQKSATTHRQESATSFQSPQSPGLNTGRLNISDIQSPASPELFTQQYQHDSVMESPEGLGEEELAHRQEQLDFLAQGGHLASPDHSQEEEQPFISLVTSTSEPSAAVISSDEEENDPTKAKKPMSEKEKIARERTQRMQANISKRWEVRGWKLSEEGGRTQVEHPEPRRRRKSSLQEVQEEMEERESRQKEKEQQPGKQPAKKRTPPPTRPSTGGKGKKHEQRVKPSQSRRAAFEKFAAGVNYNMEMLRKIAYDEELPSSEEESEEEAADYPAESQPLPPVGPPVQDPGPFQTDIALKECMEGTVVNWDKYYKMKRAHERKLEAFATSQGLKRKRPSSSHPEESATSQATQRRPPKAPRTDPSATTIPSTSSQTAGKRPRERPRVTPRQTPRQTPQHTPMPSGGEESDAEFRPAEISATDVQAEKSGSSEIELISASQQEVARKKRKVQKHAKALKYSCTECPKKFRKNTELQQHKLQHKDPTPWHCPCGRAYKWERGMKAHQKEGKCKYGQQLMAAQKLAALPSFQCRFCETTRQRESAIIEHENEHHPDQKKALGEKVKHYKCEDCGHKFTSRNAALQHKARKSCKARQALKCKVCMVTKGNHHQCLSREKLTNHLAKWHKRFLLKLLMKFDPSNYAAGAAGRSANYDCWDNDCNVFYRELGQIISHIQVRHPDFFTSILEKADVSEDEASSVSGSESEGEEQESEGGDSPDEEGVDYELV